MAETNNHEKLIKLAVEGNDDALSQLLRHHEPEIRNVVGWQLDPMLARREDISDLVQETFLTATRRFGEFAASPEPIPFRVWLRMIARDRIVDAHRKHLGAQRRDMYRERYSLPEHSSVALVGVLMSREPTPSRVVSQAELVSRVNQAIERLSQPERELIMWRHFEQLSIKETARVLKITDAAASKRYVRSLERLKSILNQFELGQA